MIKSTLLAFERLRNFFTWEHSLDTGKPHPNYKYENVFMQFN